MDPNQVPQPTPETPSQPLSPQPSSYQSAPQPSAHEHFFAHPPAAAAVLPPVATPGRTMGIVSFVLVFIGLGFVSIPLGIMALKKSKQAGQKNGFAIAGIILGIIETILAIIGAIMLVSFFDLYLSTCNELGTGTHVLTDGTAIVCRI